MKRIILYTEREELSHEQDHLGEFGPKARQNAISAAAVILAQQIPAKVIITETATGQTARNISSLRPSVPIIMATHSRRVYQQLAIVWGGKSYLHSKPREATDHVIAQLKSAGNVAKGDALVLASGHQPGVSGGTDTVTIKVVQ